MLWPISSLNMVRLEGLRYLQNHDQSKQAIVQVHSILACLAHISIKIVHIREEEVSTESGRNALILENMS